MKAKSATASLPIERREGEISDKEESPLKEEGLMLERKSEEGDVSSRTESALSYSTSEEEGSPTTHYGGTNMYIPFSGKLW